MFECFYRGTDVAAVSFWNVHGEDSMQKTRSIIAMTTTLVLIATTAPMAHARGPGGGMGGGPPGFAGPAGTPPTWQGSNPPGFSQGVKTGWNGASVPPGWSKDKKKGWNGRGVPPGLYGR